MIPVSQISTIAARNCRSGIRNGRFLVVNMLNASRWLGSGGTFFCSSGREESDGLIESTGKSPNVNRRPTRLRELTPRLREALEAVRWERGETPVPMLLSSSLPLNDHIVAKATSVRVPIQDAVEFFVWAGNQDNYQHSKKAYNNIIRRLAVTSKNCGDFFCSIANQLLDEMRRKGHAPNLQTFYSAIILCTRHGRLKEAVQIFNQMEDSGCKPSVAICTRLINCAIRENQPKVALMIYQQSSDAGYPIDNLWRYALLRSLKDAGDEEGALFISDEIRKTGAHLLSKDITLASVLSVKAGREEESWELVDQLSKLEDDTRTDYLRWLLIDLCHAGKMEAIQKLEGLIERQGIQYLHHCFYIVIGDFLTAGYNLKAACIVQRFHQPGKVKLDACRDVCKRILERIISGTDQISVLLGLLQWIVSQRLAEKLGRFSKFVFHLCEANKYHEALELTEFMLSIDSEWRSPHQDYLIDCLLQMGEDAKASQLKSKIRG